jgi:hypothetical protein
MTVGAMIYAYISDLMYKAYLTETDDAYIADDAGASYQAWSYTTKAIANWCDENAKTLQQGSY